MAHWVKSRSPDHVSSHTLYGSNLGTLESEACDRPEAPPDGQQNRLLPTNWEARLSDSVPQVGPSHTLEGRLRNGSRRGFVAVTR